MITRCVRPTPSKSFGRAVFVGLLTLLGPTTGCDLFELGETKTTVVLVDVSRTVPLPDTTIYSASFRAVLASIRPGDRLVIGKISSQSAGAFRADGDFEIPRTRIESQDDPARDSVLALAQEVFNRLLAQERSSSTDIMEVLSATQDLYLRDGSRRDQRRLVIFSDMLQEAGRLNFRRDRLDSAYTQQIIAERIATGGLPNLAGVRIYVSGAGATADRPELLFLVRSFWLRYFSATGAICDSTMYGRSALLGIE